VMRPCRTCYKSNQGVALLQLLMILLLVSTFIGLGTVLTGSYVKRNRINSTKDTINADFDSLISWAQANNRLPCAANDNTSSVCAPAGDEFSAAVKNPEDSFGKPLVYIYDSTMTDIATGGICGRSSTRLSAGSISNAALIILSGGDDYSFQSTLSLWSV